MTSVAATVAVPDWAYEALPTELADEVRSVVVPFLRPPDVALGQSVLRGMSATRLSFAQTLVRRMVEHRWQINLQQCEIDEDSTGFMAYDIQADELHISFGVYVYPPLPFDDSGQPQMFRSMQREFLGILLDGPIDMERFERERHEFDTQMWRGRSDSKVYGWTIASRGTRNFDQVVQALVDGHQPDLARLDMTGGYILRNSGYYGNGRMGTRAWLSYADTDRALSTPYHVDLFSVYLWRLVSFDLVDATARARNPHAATLDAHIKRHLGIGNSSGLGTVAALQRWPNRFSAAVLARELAFAYVKSRQGPLRAEYFRRLAELLSNAAAAYRHAPPVDPELLEPREQVNEALMRIHADVEGLAQRRPSTTCGYPWAQLVDDALGYGSVEAVEVLHSMLLELYPEVDEFNRVLNSGIVRPRLLDPSMTVEELRSILETQFGWALELDLTSAGKREFFWYRSEENGENRRGERSVDIGVERETFIDAAGTARRLYDSLRGLPDHSSVGRFLLEEPEHSMGVARAQLAADSPYSEIHASVCDADFLASNGIRAFLALLGIDLPTPHSGRWVRGLFFRGAPLPEDLAQGSASQWGIGARAATSVRSVSTKSEAAKKE
jgi:hypothetical protein